MCYFPWVTSEKTSDRLLLPGGCLGNVRLQNHGVIIDTGGGFKHFLIHWTFRFFQPGYHICLATSPSVIELLPRFGQRYSPTTISEICLRQSVWYGSGMVKPSSQEPVWCQWKGLKAAPVAKILGPRYCSLLFPLCFGVANRCQQMQPLRSQLIVSRIASISSFSRYRSYHFPVQNCAGTQPLITYNHDIPWSCANMCAVQIWIMQLSLDFMYRIIYQV